MRERAIDLGSAFGAVAGSVASAAAALCCVGPLALTLLGVKGMILLIDFVRADAGCEVMAFPGLLFGDRTHLACIALSPIDALEEKLSARPGPA